MSNYRTWYCAYPEQMKIERVRARRINEYTIETKAGFKKFIDSYGENYRTNLKGARNAIRKFWLEQEVYHEDQVKVHQDAQKEAYYNSETAEMLGAWK